MRKFLIIIVYISFTFNCFSQQSANNIKEKNTGKDILIFDLYTDLWQKAPSAAKVRSINQGVNMYVMLNMPVSTTNFSIGCGLGVSSHNFYSDAIAVLGRDITNNLNGTTEFKKLDDKYGKKIDYSINKINVTYLDLPIELRFKSRADRYKRFKASVGFKIGYNISNHSKYTGEDVLEGTADEVTIKKSNIKYINPWNYGIVARVGYGYINLMAYYSLSPIFEKDKGPQMYPVSIGISITPF
jgi:hypothetical protein